MWLLNKIFIVFFTNNMVLRVCMNDILTQFALTWAVLSFFPQD